MLTYVSPEISSANRVDDAVFLECTDGYEEGVLQRVSELAGILKMDGMRDTGDVAIKTLKDFTSHIPINDEPIFEELLSCGSISPACDGVFIYSGVFLDVFNYFSKKIEAFGQEAFPDMVHYEAPVLYPIHEYDKGGYFESFPHYIMFQSTLKSDLNVINAYSKLDSSGKENEIIKFVQPSQNVLRHAACVPIYPLYKDKTVDKEAPISIMVSGRCFRNEGANVFELARLKEFYMKEYVFIGTQQQIHEKIQIAKAIWNYWIDLFKLSGVIDTANDSFFANNYKKLKIFQILGDSKQEFKLLLPSSNKMCASSSANIHRTHFSKSYNIKNSDAYCHTGCFAFGIERLAYSLLSQKGINPEKWDEPTRKEIYPNRHYV